MLEYSFIPSTFYIKYGKLKYNCVSKIFDHLYSCLTHILITRVGDEALVAIGECSSLQYLNVSGCHQIGDAGIIAIARGCPQLTFLDVSVLQVNLSDSLFLSLSLSRPQFLFCFTSYLCANINFNRCPRIFPFLVAMLKLSSFQYDLQRLSPYLNFR